MVGTSVEAKGRILLKRTAQRSKANRKDAKEWCVITHKGRSSKHTPPKTGRSLPSLLSKNRQLGAIASVSNNDKMDKNIDNLSLCYKGLILNKDLCMQCCVSLLNDFALVYLLAPNAHRPPPRTAFKAKLAMLPSHVLQRPFHRYDCPLAVLTASVAKLVPNICSQYGD
jgi:hypothetical protein